MWYLTTAHGKPVLSAIRSLHYQSITKARPLWWQLCFTTEYVHSIIVIQQQLTSTHCHAVGAYSRVLHNYYSLLKYHLLYICFIYWNMYCLNYYLYNLFWELTSWKMVVAIATVEFIFPSSCLKKNLLLKYPSRDKDSSKRLAVNYTPGQGYIRS